MQQYIRIQIWHLSGINKRRLDALGCNYRCLVAEEETAKLAKEKGITSSMAAVEIAAKNPGRKLFVLGNAPTALYKVMEMIDSKSTKCRCCCRCSGRICRRHKIKR